MACFLVYQSNNRNNFARLEHFATKKLHKRTKMKLKKKMATALGVTALAVTVSASAMAADTIKVGILHSLSGTMAISETTLKDTMLMLIEEQNKKGGVLGKKLEAVVVDPASNWPLFAEKAKELIEKEKVAATFGCWTAV